MTYFGPISQKIVEIISKHEMKIAFQTSCCLQPPSFSKIEDTVVLHLTSKSNKMNSSKPRKYTAPKRATVKLLIEQMDLWDSYVPNFEYAFVFIKNILNLCFSDQDQKSACLLSGNKWNGIRFLEVFPRKKILPFFFNEIPNFDIF